ncbi:multidrug ABC transporter ATP-binding protein, partial [Peptococcaceae bacterium SCADC1_2_3]
MEAIRLVNLNKVIKKHPILKDINLSLGKGKIYGFFGRNGSGKTMLFRAISGLIKPTSGEVYVFGKKLGEDISFPESLGIIIESVGFWPQFTGFENLKILASIKSKISDEQITE